MRKKIKELMNKEDGFTLVELLAVIVILGIIIAIAIPAIGTVVSDSQEKADDAQIELIEDAARIYYTTTNEEGNERKSPVTVNTLITEGFLDLRGNEDKDIGGSVTLNENGSVTYNENE